MKKIFVRFWNRFAICFFTVLFLFVSLFIVGMAAEPEYENRLFDVDHVHQIDIRIAEEDLEDLLADPVGKMKYHADIIIDGEEFKDVSFSTKGNSSLYFVAADGDSSRYSFRIKFDKFVEDQTYHGLDMLSLNNSFHDATHLKDYFSYEIFRQAGVPAPLLSHVWLTINGKDHGLYYAVEDEKESFLDREFGGEGVIYKPESKDANLKADQIEDIKNNGLSMEEIHGADLIYIDDSPESYPDIFDNAETKAGKQDAEVVIEAMKSLAEGTDLSSCLNTDEIIRFFAAHNFVLDYDSYTGTYLHNLVLYAGNDRVALIPWDYNLSFGTFTHVVGEEALSDATDILDRGIDSPLIGVFEDSRPMWKWIVQDDNYRREYHDAMDALVAAYFESGQFDRDFQTMYELLHPYVEKDPTAFYTVDEFERGCEVLQQFGVRRAESVRKQLEGELSSYSEDQNDQEKVDASDLTLMDMGASFFD